MDSVKVRLEDGRFNSTNYLSYNALYAKLIEFFSSTITNNEYLLTINPLAQLFSSNGYNWSSCHNYFTVRTPEAYAAGYSAPSTYTYHLGNWQAAAGDGFLVVTPHRFVEDKQYLIGNVQRWQCWLNKDLTAIRMHLAYPGKNNDDYAKSEARIVRQLIHNVLSHYHGVGTSAWMSKALDGSVRSMNSEYQMLSNNNNKRYREIFLDEYGDVTSMSNYIGYNNEPVWSYSYLNLDHINDYDICIGRIVPILTNRSVMLSNRYSNIASLCDRVPQHFNKHDYLDMEHASVRDVDLIIIDGDVHDKNRIDFDYKFVLDKQVYSKSFKQVFFHKLVSVYVSPEYESVQCSVCNKHFSPEYTKGGVCLDDIKVSSATIFSSLVSDETSSLYFKYDSESDLNNFLVNVNRVKPNIKWKNLSSLLSFKPTIVTPLLLKDNLLALQFTSVPEDINVIDVSDVVFDK
jgi:hypothetical protein